MDKAPDAYRTISEVADDLDLQQHVLRFWESRFSQIRPLKRGGGRRYYRPDDVELLKGIRHLLYKEGYTIKGVQRILKEQGVRAVQAFAREPLANVVFEPEGYEPPRPAPTPPAMLEDDEPEDFDIIPEPTAPQVAAATFELREPEQIFEAETAPLPAPPPSAMPPLVPQTEPTQRGQVSMFRGGLQRPESGSEAAASTDLSERMRAQMAGPSHEERAMPVPALGGRASLQLALDELLACRARIDQILARR
ncbi:MAG TPA: MerR family transcriptional regulator [Rhabdaerophilum sp.]|nr:MerR family transcriptional regulator [Rhabdaerophilum sp.]